MKIAIWILVVLEAFMLAACSHDTVPVTFHNTGTVNYTVSWDIKGVKGSTHTACSEIAVNDSCQFALPIGQTVQVFAEPPQPVTEASGLLLGTMTLNVQDHPYKLHIKMTHTEGTEPTVIGGVVIPYRPAQDLADLEIETP